MLKFPSGYVNRFQSSCATAVSTKLTSTTAPTAITDSIFTDVNCRIEPTWTVGPPVIDCAEETTKQFRAVAPRDCAESARLCRRNSQSSRLAGIRPYYYYSGSS